MHRACSVFTQFVPKVGPKDKAFASWLLKKSAVCITYCFYKLFIIVDNFMYFYEQAPCITSTYNPQRQLSATAAEPFLNGSSGAYVEDMYNAWLADPKAVHAVSFQNIFIN